MSLLFDRKCRLVLTQGAETIDLSAFRIQFTVSQADVETPNNAVIRIFNLSDATINRLASGFRGVILEAGYNGNSGLIFLGDVKQYKRGKADNIDTYLDIYAADGDIFFASATMGVVNAAGTPWPAIAEQMVSGAKIDGAPAGATLDPTAGVPDLPPDFGGVLPRGKVSFGLFRWQARQLSKTLGARWFINQGKVVILPLDSYRDTGEIAVLTGETGLVGWPIATENGIEFTCLINPKIQIGARVQLDNRLIQQTNVLSQGFPSRGSVSFPALTSTDGLYRVLVLNYEGDTRGGPWYAKCVALALNPDRPRTLSADIQGRTS